MRPRRTPTTELVYRHPEGNEDNDLWCQRLEPGVIRSVWEPTAAERAAIMAGANIELVIHGEPIPPVALGVTSEQAGRAAR